MADSIDVLVLESHPRAGAMATAALSAAGHRVHQCHDEGDDRGFPCRGIESGASCPLTGPIDVALLVRPRVNPRPTRFEDGVRCAIRADVPIVEVGPDLLDPYTPWITTRVDPDDDVVAACTGAAQLRFEDLRCRVIDRVQRLLRAEAIAAGAVEFRAETRGPALDIYLTVPKPVTRGVQQALAVRVLDAVREPGPTYGQVDVHVRPADDTEGGEK